MEVEEEPPIPERPPAPALDTGLLQISAAQRRAASRRLRREWRRRYLLYGERPPPVPSYTGLVEDAEEGKIGIACSGGGIRSAAFSLGALQVLQRNSVLRNASYLAGVSGGSYIAAAFCMVRKTWPKDLPPVSEKDPVADDSDPDCVTDRHPPFFPGSPEEQYLRNRSSYMAPGALGKVQLGWRVLLGLGLNLAFIAVAVVTAAFFLALLYGWMFSKLMRHVDGDGSCAGNACHFGLAIPMWLWLPPAIIAGAGALVGAAGIVAFRWVPRLRDAVQAWSLRAVGLAGVLGGLLIGLPVLLSLVRGWGTTAPHLEGGAGGAGAAAGAASSATAGTGAATAGPADVAVVGAGGAATVGSAVLLQLRAEWVRARKVVDDVKPVRNFYRGLSQRVRLVLAYAIAALAAPLLALGLALVAMSALLNETNLLIRWAWPVGLFLALTLGCTFADLTSWSLHPFYRRRLASAFALKRVARTADTPPIGRDDAGVAMERRYHEPLPMTRSAIDPDEQGRRQWPTLLVCAAANISDDAATPPGRAVTSFTFSATAMGGPLVGAVSTAEFERSCDPYRASDFTLPAAVAMSGAALSPSMGKMTRWPLRALMTLANVRLGVWVPNPRRMADFERMRDGKRMLQPLPRPRPWYLLAEIFGRNPIDGRFLYVTDGGHYENVGLVELLRRGCTEIYCFDASNDDLDAFGDAVALARSELEVEIRIDTAALAPDPKTGLAQADCVEGDILYPGDAPAGKLYYARCAMTERSPADVKVYHRRDQRFPHDPTSDQLYTDQRFEAYRALGAAAAAHALVESGRAVPPHPAGGGDHDGGGPAAPGATPGARTRGA